MSSDFSMSPFRSRSNSLGLSFVGGVVQETSSEVSSTYSDPLSTSQSPAALIQDLLTVFIDNVYHLALPLPASRFRELLRLPESHSDAPHRGMIYAALAFACQFSKADAKMQQVAFITLARARLSDPLAMRQKPRDYVLATLILGRTRLLLGDSHEASRLALVAVQASMQIGLHRASAKMASDPSSADSRCAEDHRYWISVTAFDMEVALEQGTAPHTRVQQLAILQQLSAPDALTGSTFQNTLDGDLVRAQSSLLLHRALMLRSYVASGSLDTRSTTFVTQFRELSYALMRFRHSLPPIENAFSYPPPFSFTFASGGSQISGRRMRDGTLHTLSFAHANVLGASILLHVILGSEAASYQEIACRAAKDLAQLISSLEETDDDVLHGSIGIIITMAIRVLVDEMTARRASDLAMVNLSHIDVLRDRLESMSRKLPGLRPRLSEIEARLNEHDSLSMDIY